ncbi:MAG: tyrosine--tRNA ligase [Endomicrobium sp.]|jgi:tyrosyl-tRNA synthetase|nr:tyrosine--tRNA ligase [Endomicrobium sp.]
MLENIIHGTEEIISKSVLMTKLKNKILRIKFGVDPTAPDLHLGHSVILNKLKLFQRLGHKIIFLIGDFTAKIGDPSGKSATRIPLTDTEILNNIKTYSQQVFKILDKNKTDIVYNSSWLSKFDLNSLFNLMAKSTVAKMLIRSDFEKRYKNKQTISLVEFLYPLLQAYDSVVLNADMEIGGSDQMFNLLLGREIQRSYGQEEQIIITMPILEGIDGVKKMSKSFNNYISLNETPDNMFGKIMSISDELMYKYYKILTTEDLQYIKKIHPKEAKYLLAYKIVKQYYTKEIANKTKLNFEKIFVKKKLPDNIAQCNVHVNNKIIKLSDLIIKSGFLLSKREINRLIKQNAIKIDYKKINYDYTFNIKNYKGPIIIQIGKKRFKKIFITCN